MSNKQSILPVRYRPSIFSNRIISNYISYGLTVSEIIKKLKIEDLPEHEVLRVFVNDEIIESDQWDIVVPSANAIVNVCTVPAGGGGGGKDVLRIVAMIGVVALAVYAPYLAGPAWVAAHPVGAAMISAGVGIAGSLAINALIPPTIPRTIDADTYSQQSYSVLGVKNQALPYQPVQRVFGRHKIYPPLAAVPLSENFDSETWHRYLFCVGEGEYNIEACKLGETAIENFEYQIQIGLSGSMTSEVYPMSADWNEASLAIELTNAGGAQTQTTQADTTEIIVDITLPSGLWVQYDSGKIRSYLINFKVEYSVTGVGSWSEFPNSSIAFAGEYKERRNLSYRVTGLASDTYDVRVTKISADTPPGNNVAAGGYLYFADTAYWTALRSINYATASVALSGVTLIALRIKVTGYLAGAVEDFNCIATSKLPEYVNGAWSDSNYSTRNPAWAFAEVLRGDWNRNAITDTEIDGDNIVQWAEFCTSKGYYLDALIDKKTTVKQLLTNIAAVGRATPGMRDGKHIVIWDTTQTNIRNHFSPRNSWGYTGRKAFNDVPHALKCRFITSENDLYQEDEVIVYDDGYNSGNATEFETLDFWGITTFDHVYKLARYYIAVGRLRPELHEINIDIENLVNSRGDKVRLTHDVILVGYGQARITAVTLDGSGNCTGLSMDDVIPMLDSGSYGCQIRKANGDMVAATIVANEGEQTDITFSPSISAAGVMPAVGDMIFFGEAGSVSSDMIITRIDYGDNMSARLTMADYGSAIYTADSGAIPAYTPNITHAPIINKVPATPDIKNIYDKVGQLTMVGNQITRMYASVDFEINTLNDISPDYVEVQYRTHDAGFND